MSQFPQYRWVQREGGNKISRHEEYPREAVKNGQVQDRTIVLNIKGRGQIFIKVFDSKKQK